MIDVVIKFCEEKNISLKNSSFNSDLQVDFSARKKMSDYLSDAEVAKTRKERELLQEKEKGSKNKIDSLKKTKIKTKTNIIRKNLDDFFNKI
jgi:hypothetical protein